MVFSYSGKYRWILGRSNSPRMLVFGSRSSRKSKDFSTNFSGVIVPPVSFSQYSGLIVTVCEVVVWSQTVTLKVVSFIFLMVMGMDH